MIVALYTLFELMSIIICLFALYDKKLRLDVKTVVFIVVDVSSIVTIYLLDLSFKHTMFFYPLLFLYCGIEFGFRLKKILVNVIICMILMVGLQIVGYIVYGIFFAFVKTEEIVYVIINLIVLLLMFILTQKVKIRKLPAYLQYNDLEIIFSIVICYTLMAIKYIQFKVSGTVSYIEYAIVVIVTGYVCLITAVVKKYKKIAKDSSEELSLQTTYLNTYENMVSDIKARQHDFDNHINAILSQHYVYGNGDELAESQKKYMEEIAKENRFNKVLISGNPTLVSFLYLKFNEASARKIDIEYKLDFGELQCDVPLSKIIELVGNLLDNAIDAATKCERRHIIVKVKESGENISIEVGNTSEVIPYSKMSELFVKGKSTKGSDRGYGLYNVKRICDEYGIGLSCSNNLEEEQNYIVFSLDISKDCGS